MSGTRKLVTTSSLSGAKLSMGPSSRRISSRCHCWLASNVGQQVVFKRIKLFCLYVLQTSVLQTSANSSRWLKKRWKPVKIGCLKPDSGGLQSFQPQITTVARSHIKKKYFHMIHMHMRYVYNESM